MMRMIGDMDEAGVTMGSHDTLSKQGARAVMFVLLLAVLMALSAIFLLLSSERDGTLAAERLPEVELGRSALPRNRAEAPQRSGPQVETRAQFLRIC